MIHACIEKNPLLFLQLHAKHRIGKAMGYTRPAIAELIRKARVFIRKQVGAVLDVRINMPFWKQPDVEPELVQIRRRTKLFEPFKFTPDMMSSREVLLKALAPCYAAVRVFDGCFD